MFTRRVPGVYTPRCNCEGGREIAEHLLLDCTELDRERENLRAAIAPAPLRTYRDLEIFTDPDDAIHLVRWLFNTGKFPSYRLAENIHREDVSAGTASTPRPRGRPARDKGKRA